MYAVQLQSRLPTVLLSDLVLKLFLSRAGPKRQRVLYINDLATFSIEHKSTNKFHRSSSKDKTGHLNDGPWAVISAAQTSSSPFWPNVLERSHNQCSLLQARPRVLLN